MTKPPPHPGRILRDSYFTPRGIGVTEAAKAIGVTRQALNNVLNGKAGVSPDMAARLGRFFGLRPETIQDWQKEYEMAMTRSSRAARAARSGDPLLVRSSDLAAWADTTDARYSLPQLIRVLVRSSSGSEAVVDFPAFEDAQKSGWDGLVENSVRSAYVPLGRSSWELSTESSPGPKAESDYQKRKSDPLGVDPKGTTYIAVTARRWAKKREWLDEKTRDGFWANVIAYDAVDLEQWLESQPDVGIWFAERIRLRPRGVQSLESFWEEFRLSTSPPMTADLILAGRDTEKERVVQWLASGAGVFRVLADSPDEALAFVAASCQRGGDAAGLDWLRRTVVATDREQVQQLVSLGERLTLGWRLDDFSLLGSLVEKGHRAVLPLARGSAVTGGADIDLPRLARAQFLSALGAAFPNPGGGEQDGEASFRARKCGRSITVYRRLFPSAGAAKVPVWATREEAARTIPLMLAGSWDGQNAADRRALAKLAGSEYGEVSRAVARWEGQADSPIRLVGGAWTLTAPLDAWSCLCRYVGPVDLERYREVVIEVLGENDPRLELAPGRRWFPNPFGKRFDYSDSIREGLAESLVLLAVVAEEAGAIVVPAGERLSARLVRELLGGRADRRRWASLSDVLPRLAEAAPDAFLSALEDDLRGESPCVLSLFEAEGSPLGGGDRHPHLLWALEILAWYPEYLTRSALALAKLQRLAPEIKIANRPSASLREIFCNWHRNTAASLDQRLQAIDLMVTKESGAAWALLLDLLPKFHDSSEITAGPRWRARPDVAPLAKAEVWQAGQAVIDRALDLAVGDAGRLSALVSGMRTWSPEQRQRLARQVEKFAETCTSVDERTRFWNGLRAFLASHRAFPKAAWSVAGAELADFERVLPKFEPSANWESKLWLFDRLVPDTPNVDERPARDWERDAADKRREVVLAIIEREGVEGLVRFSRRVREPALVGVAAAEAIGGAGVDEQVLDAALAHEEDCVRTFGLGFGFRRRELEGDEWSGRILNGPAFPNWPARKKSEFCLCLPAVRQTWEMVSDLGAEVERGFWGRTPVHLICYGDADAEVAVSKLLKYNRCLDAVCQAGLNPDKLADLTLVGILENAVPELARSAGVTGGVTLEYYLERIFERLRGGSAVPPETLGMLEWQYLPLLGPDANAATLNGFLERDPSFFAKVVTYAFEPDGDGGGQDAEALAEGESADRRRVRARMSWNLLNSWQTPPGLRPDGGLDAEVLRGWVRQARAECKALGRSRTGDDRIGRLLANVPSDGDGAWPHTVVRDLVEEAESRCLEAGICAGRFDSRGPRFRNPLEGGASEKALAKQYRGWASAVRGRWPATGRLLDSIADVYDGFGRNMDSWTERLDQE